MKTTDPMVSKLTSRVNAETTVEIVPLWVNIAPFGNPENFK
jgi:hypothetical protein